MAKFTDIQYYKIELLDLSKFWQILRGLEDARRRREFIEIFYLNVSGDKNH